jgi:hypothetical protein
LCCWGSDADAVGFSRPLARFEIDRIDLTPAC